MSDFKDINEANAAYEHLKKLYELSKKDIRKLQEDLFLMVDDHKLLTAKLENCDKAHTIIKNTMIKAITDHNIEKQGYIEEIQRLREEANNSNPNK